MEVVAICVVVLAAVILGVVVVVADLVVFVIAQAQRAHMA